MTWEGLSPPYGTIVADPPWPFVWSGGVGGRRRRATSIGYSVTTVDEIAAMPVGDLAAADAYLFLWVTPKLFREGEGVRVARAWGFEPFAEYIWHKPNFGTGAVPRAAHEPLLVARRGSPPVSDDRGIPSVQRWNQDRASGNGGKVHSQKPSAALDLIERTSPGPYVELFCRRPRFGWDSWGHGYEIGGAA